MYPLPALLHASAQADGLRPGPRQRALQLYLEGTSPRAISRLLGVNHQRIATRIAQHANQLPDAVMDVTLTETVEVDERVTFVRKKSVMTSSVTTVR